MMTSILKRYVSAAIIFLIPAFAWAQAQVAQDLTGVANNILGHMDPMVLALTAAGFVVGFAFLIGAAVSLKRYGLAGPGGGFSQSTLKNPLISGLAGVLMLWLSYTAGVGGQSIFGVGATPNTISGSNTVIVQ